MLITRPAVPRPAPGAAGAGSCAGSCDGRRGSQQRLCSCPGRQGVFGKAAPQTHVTGAGTPQNPSAAGALPPPGHSRQ